MLTERVGQVQPQQLHDDDSLVLSFAGKCGLPGLLQAVIRPRRPHLDGPPSNGRRIAAGRPWSAIHPRRVSSTASGLSDVGDTPAHQNTSNSRDAARRKPFAAGSSSTSRALHPATPISDLDIQHYVACVPSVPPPPRCLIDRESLEASSRETHAFVAPVAAVRIL
jgi:hypothetical protein